MKKSLLVLFIVAVLLVIGNFAQARDYGTFEITDSDEALQLSENQVIAIARANVKAGLGKGAVIEYFGDAHRQILIAQAQEAGFSEVDANDLVAQALAEKKLAEQKKEKGGGPKALAKFYAALNTKRADCKIAAEAKIKQLEGQIAALKSPTLSEEDKKILEGYKKIIEEQKKQIEDLLKNTQVAQQAQAGAGDTATVKKQITEQIDEEDPLAIAKKAMKTAQEALNLATSAKNKADEVSASWQQALDEACGDDPKLREAIGLEDKKIMALKAMIENLSIVVAYISSPDPRDVKKGQGLLYLILGDELPTKKYLKQAKDAVGIKLPYCVNEKIIDKEVFPKEEEKEEKKPENERSLQKPPRNPKYTGKAYTGGYR